MNILATVGKTLQEVQDEQIAYAIKDTKRKISYILHDLDNPPTHVKDADPDEFVSWHIYRYEQLAELFGLLANLLKDE